MVENVKELLKLHEGITHEVYLDNENSSIVPQEVVDEMLPYFNKKAYGNPTLTHKPGWEAFEVIMNCFQKISKSIGAKNLEDITFTPGETEANNLAIMGTCFARKNHRQKNSHLRNRAYQRFAGCGDDAEVRVHNAEYPS